MPFDAPTAEKVKQVLAPSAVGKVGAIYLDDPGHHAVTRTPGGGRHAELGIEPAGEGAGHGVA
jgi:hypothetical protein